MILETLKQEYSFKVIQGSTKQFTVRVKDSAGAIIDMSGMTGSLKIATAYGVAPELEITTASGITFDSDGSAIITITASQTSALTVGRKVYDLEMTDGAEIAKPIYGTIEVLNEVNDA